VSGLIIDTCSWQVAAIPFPKFFNLGERPESSIELLPREPLSCLRKSMVRWEFPTDERRTGAGQPRLLHVPRSRPGVDVSCGTWQTRRNGAVSHFSV